MVQRRVQCDLDTIPSDTIARVKLLVNGLPPQISKHIKMPRNGEERLPGILRKPWTLLIMSHLQHVVLLGGLEPAFRVLFSVIFHDDFLGISIRVQSSGFAEEKLS